MYVSHEDIAIDKIQNVDIWRYMDLWKFLKIVNSSSLFFAPIDMLGDNNEGKMPDQVFQFMKEHDKRNNRNDNFVEVYRDFMEQYSKNKTLISSWTAADNESFALWKMYAKDKLGVAIRTSFEGLKNCFHKTDEEIFIGQVEYFDKKNPAYNFGKFPTVLNKHIYYNFEREVRCLNVLGDDEEKAPKNIPVDLNILIEEIYLSPSAFESGLHELIEVLRDKHDLKFKINMSGISDSWL